MTSTLGPDRPPDHRQQLRFQRVENYGPAVACAGMTKIVIADDHRVVRSGLRMVLDREEDFEVVAEAGDVAEARRYVRAHRPDVLVLDLNMPGDPSLPAIPPSARSHRRPAWSS